MGIVPLEFENGKTRQDYGFTGRETIDIPVQQAVGGTRRTVTARVTYPDGKTANVPLLSRIDTVDELAYFKNGGILPYVLRNLLAA
jgi:aconitate hydratase